MWKQSISCVRWVGLRPVQPQHFSDGKVDLLLLELSQKRSTLVGLKPAQIGFRVPNFIISPFVKKHYVGHAAMDHTAVARFLEQRFNLPALTKRDAAQPNLLDFFDFTNKPWATPPPQAEVPVPPAVGGTCHPASFVP